jgi:hypothetical protein
MKEMCYMGMFLNRGNEEFTRVLNSGLYVDKMEKIHVK